MNQQTTKSYNRNVYQHYSNLLNSLVLQVSVTSYMMSPERLKLHAKWLFHFAYFRQSHLLIDQHTFFRCLCNSVTIILARWRLRRDIFSLIIQHCVRHGKRRTWLRRYLLDSLLNHTYFYEFLKSTSSHCAQGLRIRQDVPDTVC